MERFPFVERVLGTANMTGVDKVSHLRGQDHDRTESRLRARRRLARIERPRIRTVAATVAALSCLLATTAFIAQPAGAQAPTCQGATVTVDLGAGDVPTGNDDVILGTASSDTINGLGGNDTICSLGGNDNIYGGPGDDLIYGGGGNDWIAGGPGADTIYGQPGGDTLNGGSGNDLLLGGPGFDVIYGNEGDDNVQGAGGNDTLYGGDGDDDMYGKPGDDIMHGGDGDDEMFGAAGDDEMYGGPGADEMQGASGDDTMAGDADDDVLYGQLGNDDLAGGDGDDLLFGAAGDDVLDGGAGVDDLQGAAGDDALTGGSGADTLFGGAGLDDYVDGRTVEDACFDPDQNNQFICLTEQPPTAATLNLTFVPLLADFGPFPPPGGLTVTIRPAVTTTTTMATATIPGTVVTVIGSSCAQLAMTEPTAINCVESTNTSTLPDYDNPIAVVPNYTPGSITIPTVDYFVSVQGGTPDPFCSWSGSNFGAIPANQQDVTIDVAVACA